ncbi:MAG: hypothetical protein BWY66_01108 [bacterium ADurb.Bin374]|nr:MAG: hypothetical protein BWY66_01108 [bacterium ADurb.Bin374]
MYTVQRSVSLNGVFAASARLSYSPAMSMPSLLAVSSRKLPVPAAQTLFMRKSTTKAWLSDVYFASWPPSSKIVSTSGRNWVVPRAWAVTSFTTSSAPTNRFATSRPEPVVPTPSTFTRDTSICCFMCVRHFLIAVTG